MSEQNEIHDENANTNAAIGASGFEQETGGQAPANNGEQNKAHKASKGAQMKANLSATFGSGVGRISLILVGVALLATVAFAYRGLTAEKQVVSTSVVDTPTAPQTKIQVSAVTPEEAAVRQKLAEAEASNAAASGQSYQPEFMPIIEDKKTIATTQSEAGQVAFHVPGSNAVVETKKQESNVQPITGIKTGQASAAQFKSANTPSAQTAPVQTNTAGSGQPQSEAERAAMQKMEQERQQLLKAREDYTNKIKAAVLSQVTKMSDPSGGLNKSFGGYSQVTYYQEQTENTDQKTSVNSPANSQASAPDSLGNPNGKLLIKTGSIDYCELDGKVNTDDGDDIIATIRGGEWDGAKIIGRIERAPRNIRFIFSTLAPQDDRPTMRINAVALREEDASQGMAENIDHHTFERYTALGAASILTGLGKAAQMNTGTTVYTPGGVVTTTQDELSDKRIAAIALGEMGTAAGQEIRKGFNRPTTYSTPAKTGFALFYMQDVFEQSNR